MLNEVVIKQVCMAKIPFDFELPVRYQVFAAMSTAAADMHIRFTHADYLLFNFLFSHRDMYPDLFNNPDKIGILRTVQVLAICTAMVNLPFKHHVSDEVMIHSAMAQCAWWVREYTIADVKFIEFLYNTTEYYFELFKKEEN